MTGRTFAGAIRTGLLPSAVFAEFVGSKLDLLVTCHPLHRQKQTGETEERKGPYRTSFETPDAAVSETGISSGTFWVLSQ